MPGLRVDRATNHSTTSVSMPVSRSRNGAGKDGYIPTIHAAGSNGTAATTWGDECLTRTLGRSNAGKQSAVTSVSFSLRASLVICHAADGNGAFAEASADAEVKSSSAAFWSSVRLSRFAKRSVLAAGVALLLLRSFRGGDAPEPSLLPALNRDGAVATSSSVC